MMEQSSVEVTRLIGGVGRNVAKLFFAVFSMYFLLRDGPRLMREARAMLEGILGPRVHDYLDAAGSTTQAVVYALMLGALAQGAVAGIGYWIFGVEAPVLMGAVTVMIALIPFGAPMVWGSLATWMLVTGDMWHGVGLMLWGLLLVSWVDNIVRPLVISNATRMPFLLVVFGVLGGVLAFGLVGLFIGPVLLAVSLAIWREWLEEHQTKETVTSVGRTARRRLGQKSALLSVRRQLRCLRSRILSMRTPSMSMISIFRSRQVSVSPALGMRPRRASTKPATV